MRIDPIHRIIQTVPIQIRIPAGKSDWVLGRPPSDIQVVITEPEPHQVGVLVVKAAGIGDGGYVEIRIVGIGVV